MQSLAKSFPPAIKKHRHALVLVLVVLVIAVNSLYELAPPHLYSPDIQYVKAKVMYVLQGQLFTDPVTGVPTFHPPYFHVFLAPLKAIGLSWRWILLLVSLTDFSLLVFFTYRIVGDQYDRTTGLFTAVTLPFIVQLMGCTQPLLPTAFYFSVSFYMAGLWLYLKPFGGMTRSVLVGVLWGLAYLISPTWFFLIGFVFLYDLVWKRKYARWGVMVGTFAVMMIPFIYQAWTLYDLNLHTARTFEFWRGVPGLSFWGHAIPDYFSPLGQSVINVGPIMFMAVMAVFLYLTIRSRRIHWMVVVSFLAYLFTEYHFSHQYAIRIQLILSIFIIARLAEFFVNHEYRRIGIAFLVVLAAYGSYDHFADMQKRYEADNWIAEHVELKDRYVRTLRELTDPGDYILATKSGYLFFAMSEVPVHALAAYRTTEYFQVPKRISDVFEADYQRARDAATYEELSEVLDRYGIEVAILTYKDFDHDYNFIHHLQQRWRKAYDDGRAKIYRRPTTDKRGPSIGNPVP